MIVVLETFENGKPLNVETEVSVNRQAKVDYKIPAMSHAWFNYERYAIKCYCLGQDGGGKSTFRPFGVQCEHLLIEDGLLSITVCYIPCHA